jgi:hypothetical protein
MEACLKYLSKTEHKLEEATAFASGLTTISELGIDISVCLPFNPLAGVVEDQSRLTLATFATRFSKVAVTDSEDIPYLISCILENRSSDSHILPHEARWFSRKAVIHTRWLQAVLDLSKVSEIRPDRVPAPASM